MTLLFFWIPARTGTTPPEPEPEPEVTPMLGDGGTLAYPWRTRRRDVHQDDEEIAAALLAFITQLRH